MSNEPQEPVISLALDDNDIAGYREQTANRPRLKDIDKVSEGGASRGLVMLLFALLLLLGAGNYLMYREMGAEQLAHDKALATEQSRIAALERAMSATGANISEQETEVKSVLKDLDQEVRKLWDNVWKAAKTRLDDHDSKIAALEKQAEGSDAAAAEAKKALAAERSDREELAKSVAALESSVSGLDALSKSVTSQASSIQDLNSKVTALGKKVSGADGDTASAGIRLDSLEVRVADNEEWIKSNNAFRRQVIKDIRAMKKTVAQLQRDMQAQSAPPAQ